MFVQVGTRFRSMFAVTSQVRVPIVIKHLGVKVHVQALQRTYYICVQRTMITFPHIVKSYVVLTRQQSNIVHITRWGVGVMFSYGTVYLPALYIRTSIKRVCY